MLSCLSSSSASFSQRAWSTYSSLAFSWAKSLLMHYSSEGRIWDWREERNSCLINYWRTAGVTSFPSPPWDLWSTILSITPFITFSMPSSTFGMTWSFNWSSIPRSFLVIKGITVSRTCCVTWELMPSRTAFLITASRSSFYWFYL